MKTENLDRINYIWDKGINKFYTQNHPSFLNEEHPSLYIQVFNDQSLADVDDSELRLYWKTKDGERVGNESGELIHANRAVFKITPSSEMLVHDRPLKGELYFTNETEIEKALKVNIQINHQIRMEVAPESNDASTRTEAMPTIKPLFKAPVVKGRIEYRNYSTIEKKIKQFSNYSTIGRDASGDYDLYKIVMGNPSKPTILITAASHGVEWQTVAYSMAFFEKLRDNTYPDTEFRNYFLENYQIVYLPVLNPHGLDKNDDLEAPTDLTYYRNAKGVDLNRDFAAKSQAETKNVIRVMDTYKAFAHMDLHMYQPTYDVNNNFIVGNELDYTKKHQRIIAYSLDQFTNQGVTIWEPRVHYKKRARGYTAALGNDYTTESLSILSEQVRPIIADGKEIRRLTNEELYTNGHAFLHIFFKTADYYFKKETEK